MRHSLGVRAPRGYGWPTNPKRAAYNQVYYRKNKAWGKAGPYVAGGFALFVLFSLLAG
ncbi:hypothetical protein J2D73_00025 [Acetobacter sacchari]|uniref:Uncharacterized protein n=1 Tax=Acetobacter sacchari TaxID=2661687 RepID=A0ABS3LQK5_9PROT|nr:hypothetical protein [Acetobacter sacchari]MBO1358185.1 hypothetical protein [Acetobacter sacchari]